MRVKLTYEVEGLDEFISMVNKKPEQVKQAVSKELNRSALRIETTAKETAPWDTGWLSNNIYSMAQALLTYDVISPVHYSIYQELGTRYMPAQPFLYPAVQKEFPILMRNLKKLVGG